MIALNRSECGNGNPSIEMLHVLVRSPQCSGFRLFLVTEMALITDEACLDKHEERDREKVRKKNK